MSQGQRLKADAAAAAEVRSYRTDPDVVALKVDRTRVFGEWFVWASIGTLLVFAMVTVQIFVARGAAVGSLQWIGAWFLEPGIVAGLIGVLIWESVTTRWLGEEATGWWTRTAKWGLLGCTYAMNTWHAWAGGPDWYGVVAHSIPPIGVFVLTECRVEMLTKLERCVVAAHEHTQRRNAERAAVEAGRKAEETEQATTTAPMSAAAAVIGPVVPVGPVAVPAFQAGPVRPGPAASVRPDVVAAVRPADRPAGQSPVRPADRPADRPAGSPRTGPPERSGAPARNGPARKRTGTPRTDAELSAAVRELAEQAGAPPSSYQLKQRFGVGSGRAARLLAELGELTPAGDPGHNGTARTEGAR